MRKRIPLEQLLALAETTATTTCDLGHDVILSLGELEESLLHDACYFEDCGVPITEVSPETFRVCCVDCAWADSGDWVQVAEWMSMDCPECAGRTPNIYGSWNYLMKKYHELTDLKSDAAFTRAGRADISTLLLHLCSRESLVGILKDRCIRASPTGLFHREGHVAVCLTEAPLSFAKEFRERKGKFGVAFNRQDILNAGGSPVIQLTDSQLASQKSCGGFATELKPFINVLRWTAGAKQVFDCTHEREWRVATDLKLEKVVPVGLIFPEAWHPSIKFAGEDWQLLLLNVFTYGELTPGASESE